MRNRSSDNGIQNTSFKTKGIILFIFVVLFGCVKLWNEILWRSNHYYSYYYHNYNEQLSTVIRTNATDLQYNVKKVSYTNNDKNNSISINNSDNNDMKSLEVMEDLSSLTSRVMEFLKTMPVVSMDGKSILSPGAFDEFASETLVKADVDPFPVLDLSTIPNHREYAKLLGYSMARVFTPRDVSTWCVKVKNRREGYRVGDLEHNYGLLYSRSPKCASSTLAGIVIRIAQKWGHKLFGERCRPMYSHIRGRKFGERNRTESFLLTSVREPTARALSRVFFTNIGEYGANATDRYIIAALQNFTDVQKGSVSPGMGGFQLSYTSTSPILQWSHYNRRHPTKVQNLELLGSYVKNVIDNYDFIILVERFHESLVALQLLMGLDTSDILHLSAKNSGGYAKIKKKCYHIQKSVVTDRVGAFLASPKWSAINFGDIMLHSAVNRSLDITIKSIGQSTFDEALRQFLELKERVDGECLSEVIFPCSSNGTFQENMSRQNCYFEDSGCGYPCIDRQVVMSSQA